MGDWTVGISNPHRITPIRGRREIVARRAGGLPMTRDDLSGRTDRSALSHGFSPTGMQLHIDPVAGAYSSISLPKSDAFRAVASSEPHVQMAISN